MKKRSKLVPVYLCGTDAAYHIPGDANGVTVYFDEESLRKCRGCTNHGCGIVKLQLDTSNPITIQKEDWEKKKSSSISIDVLARRELLRSYKAIFTSWVRAFNATRRYFKWCNGSRRNMRLFSKTIKHTKS